MKLHGPQGIFFLDSLGALWIGPLGLKFRPPGLLWERQWRARP